MALFLPCWKANTETCFFSSYDTKMRGWRRVFVLFFVGLFRIVDFLFNKGQLFIGIFLQCPVKTGLIAHMTLAGVNGYLDNQAVLVAIDKYLLNFLPVAAFFAFFPQFLA